MKEVAALVIAYFLGAIPVGLLVGKARGIDIRELGSGNIGATNVLRTLGPGPAAVVFVLDTAKGLVPVIIASRLGVHPIIIVIAGLSAILGHNLSVLLKFKGGKGVATSLGVIIALNPLVAAIAFGIWLVIVAATRYISIASIIAGLSVPIMMELWTKGRPSHYPYTIFAAAAALLIVVKHRSNIARLLAHTEPKLGQKVDVRKP